MREMKLPVHKTGSFHIFYMDAMKDTHDKGNGIGQIPGWRKLNRTVLFQSLVLLLVCGLLCLLVGKSAIPVPYKAAAMIFAGVAGLFILALYMYILNYKRIILIKNAQLAEVLENSDDFQFVYEFVFLNDVAWKRDLKFLVAGKVDRVLYIYGEDKERIRFIEEYYVDSSKRVFNFQYFYEEDKGHCSRVELFARSAMKADHEEPSHLATWMMDGSPSLTLKSSEQIEGIDVGQKERIAFERCTANRKERLSTTNILRLHNEYPMKLMLKKKLRMSRPE